MKKSLLLCLLLLPAFFMSCDDEVENFVPKQPPNLTTSPDIISPVVQIDAPENGDSLLIIDWVTIVGKVRDDKGLSIIKYHLTEPTGASSQLRAESFEHLNGYQAVGLHEFFVWVPVDRNTLPGSYTVAIEAMDRGRNVTVKAVNFRIHASAIGLAEFINPFKSSSIFSGLDWFGFEGPVLELNEEWFYFVLFGLVNTDDEYWISEAEWKQFKIDFGLKEDDNWQKWDVDGNNKMGEEEFNVAAKSLHLFRNWDTDHNGFIYKEEFAKGVFISWDLNKDNKLSREEYLDKFFTYLRR